MKFFHGTRFISQQIFTSFHMAADLHFFEKRYIQDATEDICRLSQHLLGSRYLCKASYTLCEGVIAPGQLNVTDLSISEILSLQQFFNRTDFVPSNVLCAQRIIHRGHVIHTSSYAERVKANDSVLTLKTVKGVFKLRKCIIIRLCNCLDASCSCQRECLFILDVLACKTMNVFDTHVGDNISKHIMIVSNTQLTRVCRPGDVDSKCIMLYNTNQEMHIIKLPALFEN